MHHLALIIGRLGKLCISEHQLKASKANRDIVGTELLGLHFRRKILFFLLGDTS
jgi:hypothetical protein